MSLYSVIILNTEETCLNIIEQQINIDSLSGVIVSLPSYSNAVGPFNVYTGSTGTTAVFVSKTRDEMISGVTLP